MPTSDIKKGPLYVDSTNNRVGIGTASPSEELHVIGDIITSGYYRVASTQEGGIFDTSGNNGLTVTGSSGSPASTIRAYAGGSERMRIDSLGNVGIGTVSPHSGSKLHILAAGTTQLRLDSSGTATGDGSFIRFMKGGTDIAYIGVAGTIMGSTSNDTMFYAEGANNMRFSTNGVERLRITSAGNLLFGCTAFPSASVAGFTINGTSSGNASSSGASTAAYNHLLFYNGNGLVGYISTSGSTTSFANVSDYRLKTAVNYDWDATTRLKQLRPARFEWIADGDDAVPVDGFLAHEVQDIVPESITGTKDAMRDEEYEVTPAVLDEDGNEVTPAVMGTRSVPDYQGIDQSKLVPLLVKTIQELEARIVALEAK